MFEDGTSSASEEAVTASSSGELADETGDSGRDEGSSSDVQEDEFVERMNDKIGKFTIVGREYIHPMTLCVQYAGQRDEVTENGVKFEFLVMSPDESSEHPVSRILFYMGDDEIESVVYAHHLTYSDLEQRCEATWDEAETIAVVYLYENLQSGLWRPQDHMRDGSDDGVVSVDHEFEDADEMRQRNPPRDEDDSESVTEDDGSSDDGDKEIVSTETAQYICFSVFALVLFLLIVMIVMSVRLILS